jgi:hypothetical protein
VDWLLISGGWREHRRLIDLRSSPPAASRLSSNLRLFSGGHPRRPRLATHTPQRHGGGVLAVIRGEVVDLASDDF